MKKILVVGGVAGGATAAARLRRLNEDDEIIVFERGEYISFANCGLPYYIGNVITDRKKLLVQTVEGMSKRFKLDIRIFSEVISIDKKAKTVKVRSTKTGDTYTEDYDVWYCRQEQNLWNLRLKAWMKLQTSFVATFRY